MEKRKDYLRPILTRKNKKGAIWDVFFIGIMLFVGAIVVLFALWIMGSISDVAYGQLREVESEISGEQNVSGILPDVKAKYQSTMDFVFLGVLLALLAGGLVAAFIVDFHPVFVIFFIIVLAIAVIVAVPMSNSWEAIIDSGHFTNESVHLTITDHIMMNLPLIIGAIGFLMIIVMYAKTARGREEYV